MNRPHATVVTHAGERAAERVGVALSLADLRVMSQRIRDGKAIRLRDRRNGMHQYLVIHNCRSFRVVVEPTSGHILTVLDPMGKKRRR